MTPIPRPKQNGTGPADLSQRGRPGRSHARRDRRGSASRAGFQQHRDARQGAVVTTFVLAAVAAAAFFLAPVLDATPFWQGHFPDSSSRTGLLIYAPLVLAGGLARAWNPLTWESELVSRGAKALGHAGLSWWLLGPLLEAPRLAAMAVFLFLLAVPLTGLQVARQASSVPRDSRQLLLMAPVGSLLAGAGLAFGVWTAASWLGVAMAAVPSALLLVGLPVLAVRHARKHLEADDDARGVPGALLQEEPGGPLDLPAGTLRPPGGHLVLGATLAALFGVLFIVAPGLPLTAPIAWVALMAALPLVARALLARQGTVHPRALAGPTSMRRHESRVEWIGDDRLQRLDDAAHRFLRWGHGRKALAREIAGVLEPADPLATPQRIETRLTGLPRGPWGRRFREDTLVRLLVEGGLAEGESR